MLDRISGYFPPDFIGEKKMINNKIKKPLDVLLEPPVQYNLMVYSIIRIFLGMSKIELLSRVHGRRTLLLCLSHTFITL